LEEVEEIKYKSRRKAREEGEREGVIGKLNRLLLRIKTRTSLFLAINPMKSLSWLAAPQQGAPLVRCASLTLSLSLLGRGWIPAAHAFTSPIRSKHKQRSCCSLSASNVPRIIFSDIDGSLVHYPKKNDLLSHEEDDGTEDNMILALPPSATGMRGIISSKTLSACRDLRTEGVVLVLVSGMRTSTLFNRLPYLPRADLYVTEAGGRIFYPTSDDDDNDVVNSFFQYAPLEYSGAREEDLELFGLREDMTWRTSLEEGGAGTEAYIGNEVDSNRCDGAENEEECLIDYEFSVGFPEEEVPVAGRSGSLWEYARQLEGEGFVLDTKSYSTCFRVNRKHQSGVVVDKFDALLAGDSSIGHNPREIGKSTNLGCIDYYPASSGKRNSCSYIANLLGIDMTTESVCICDDDNDIEMALACAQAYIPRLGSASMGDVVQRNPTKFIATFQEGVEATAATEEALRLIYDSVVVGAENETTKYAGMDNNDTIGPHFSKMAEDFSKLAEEIIAPLRKAFSSEET